MPCTVIAGGQWGDEAKGKFAAYLTVADHCDIACRAGDGPGAGHTVIVDDRPVKLCQTPAGFIREDTQLLLGAGVLVGPSVVLREIEDLGLQDRLRVDGRASIVLPEHVAEDRSDPHLAGVVQTTGSGHGPCFADRALRQGPLVRDCEELAPYVADVAREVNDALDAGRRVLVEGTGGYLLSMLYGTYPHVVGKDLTASTFAADVGIGPRRVDDVVLVFKAFPTRVGPGPFPTEMPEQEATRRGFIEHATVTGRRRRVGSFDFDLAREAVRVNHPTLIALSFLDRIDPDCRGKRYQDLSANARRFIDRIEDETDVPVSLLGTGPGTHDVIDRRERS